jgi:hypothetical protein
MCAMLAHLDAIAIFKFCLAGDRSSVAGEMIVQAVTNIHHVSHQATLVCSGFTELSITYASPRGDDLDSRLLRANVLKGVLEGTTTATVNLVNADLLAKSRGLKCVSL